eukprot:CAMPEP_0194352806 /NCGR_PEP_ID=MMETSP0174-20130528/1245_1 /TAXON_ID=216777 /ORGANISM="Proboscia alata, Strain PI-D3" /LENGTH=2344 /DNA_ID=CAMNT_0039121105 /DNA_START=159 /DNA_END=7193 /DNA_ORIENTATION=-
MAEREAIQKRYAYQEMSNKVEQADRSKRSSNEPTGEVESIWGRTDAGKMGDRISKAVSESKSKSSRSSELAAKMEKSQLKREKLLTQNRGGITGGHESVSTFSGGQTILDLGSLTGYQPTKPKARSAYERLLTILSSPRFLGAQEPQVIRDGAQEVLGLLKDEELRDPERHDGISRLLTGRGVKGKAGVGGVESDEFARLVSLGKDMDDYRRAGDEAAQGNGGGDVDEEMGVAVVFDESDDSEGNSDEDREADEVVSTSSSEEGDALDDDDGGVSRRETLGRRTRKRARDDEPNTNPPPTPTTATSKLSILEIDAHWLQRRLSAHYNDAELCAKLAENVLTTLETKDPRECENGLLVLLNFELFDVIKLLLNNRARIWGCVRYRRVNTNAANQEDKEELEYIREELLADPSGDGPIVWKELNLRDEATEENWTQDRVVRMADSAKKEAERLGGAKKKDSHEEVNAALDNVTRMDVDDSDTQRSATTPAVAAKDEITELDLESLAFQEGAHTMTNTQCHLPDQSWRAMKKGYEEVHVPATRSIPDPNETLVPISSLPPWTQNAFEGMTTLNRVQSKMYHSALLTGDNLLLCAPTGAGKTNVAMLAMLNIIGRYRRDPGRDANPEDTGDMEKEIEREGFKIVYVAPMKALVQEVVKNFRARLAHYQIEVRELSGDSSLSRQQIRDTQILVTTPEKWDIVTRQGEGRAYTQLVKLVIIDEIHLLHDDRGPVLETIVSRTLRQIESSHEPIRLVGLSATLPNYKDVAAFLRVPDRGCFFFDHSYRPVPLQQQYIGITEQNAFKRFQLMNEICYDKCCIQRRNSNPLLIFVHSRAECGKTAKALRDLALEREELGLFVREGGATHEILAEELPGVKNGDLRDVLQYGFAIHHAGMGRTDRELVEDLFADRHIAVLVCTATLAWGVNLPAHAVIIKGTQIYNPTKGKWCELSPLDVLQMLGRAGRPQYDTEGEGLIMTNHSKLQYYLSLTNQQLPIESQLIKCLADHLNAEVVLNSIQSLEEGVDWLRYSFLQVRMSLHPTLYGISEALAKEDPELIQRRRDLIHTAATRLETSNLVRYDRRSGSLQSTPLGRVASHFYISHASMALYSRHLRPNMSDIELLRLFSLSGEFAHITVREDEKLELVKLSQKVPIPVKESPGEPSAKVNILLQAYISKLNLEGFALVSDMAFVQQSAARIMRALFEIALKRKWSEITKLTLDFANMIASRVWKSQSPLRQFPGVPDIVSRKLERKSDIEWGRYTDLTPQDLGELVGVPKMGRTIHRLVHQFPKLELSAHVQPLTRSLLRVELTLTPDFEYSVEVHGYVQLFHIFVEDVNDDQILHAELFALRSSAANDEHCVNFTVPILDPLSPQYFVRVVSDRWLHSETVLPINFQSLILPAKFPPSTELLDLQPLPLSALGNPSLIRLYKDESTPANSMIQNKGFREFNPIQTQTFHELFKTDSSVLVCAPTGSGKTVCGEFAILRMLSTQPNGKCVYLHPKPDIVSERFDDWQTRFGALNVSVGMLTGETMADLKVLATCKIVVGSVAIFDALSRRWKQRRSIQQLSLLIVDELHLLGGEDGPIMEVLISRMRYMTSMLPKQSSDDKQQPQKLRMVGLSASLANAKEVGEWMGISSSKSTKALFNFSPKVRPIPLEIYIQSFDVHSFSGRLLAMGKPVFHAVLRHATEGGSGAGTSVNGGGGEKVKKPVIIFVPSRRQAQLTAIDLMTYADHLDDDSQKSLFQGRGYDADKIAKLTPDLQEPALGQVISSGIGFLHDGMLPSDYSTVLDLYHDESLQILIVPFTLCWKLTNDTTAHLVIIMGTESYDGRERRYIDHPIADLLQMMGKASRPRTNDVNGKCVLFTYSPKKEYLKKLLYEPLPMESHLDHYLHDHLNSEIVTQTIDTLQDAVDYVTWTLLYRRLLKNPNYYNMQGTTNAHLSEHVSEMVETVISDLEESKCVQIKESTNDEDEEDDGGGLVPLNLGMIAAYYYIQYTTIELMASSVSAKTKVRGVLEILSASSEFGTLAIRHGEESRLKILHAKLKRKGCGSLNTQANTAANQLQFNDSNTKALVLLQAHFHRQHSSLSTDLVYDLNHVVLKESIKLLQAIVDVISSNGWLKPALAAMELSQMVVQGLWKNDHVLLQIPHFTDEIVKRCDGHKGGKDEDDGPIDSVFDILTLDDDVRNDLLRLPDSKMADVAQFCNAYPNIDVSYKVQDEDDVTAGDAVQILVQLEREVDDEEEEEEEEHGVVSAPLFPGKKKESWWVVVGDTKTNALYSLKRITLDVKQSVKLEFIAPEEAGDYDLTLFCMSDCYIGCDQEYSVPLSVAAGDDSDDSDSNDSGSEEDEKK